MSQRARFSPETPYNALPLLPPKGELETKVVMKALVGARAALAELKQAGELIPNQSILINTVPVLEARASSEIENIVTTADRLFRFAHDDESDHGEEGQGNDKHGHTHGEGEGHKEGEENCTDLYLTASCK